MKLATISIDKPVPFILLFVVLTIIGIFGFKSLTVQDFPDVDFPTVTVSVSLKGAAASQMETEVTRKIEDSVAGIERIDHISSTINEGVSTTVITFELEKDIKDAVNEVRDSVSRIRQQLPSGITEPVISRITTTGGAILTYAVGTTEGDVSLTDEERMSWFVDNDVSKKLLSVAGVGKVSRLGGVSREARIEVDPVSLAGSGITPSSLSQQLSATIDDAPSGAFSINGEEQSARTMGRFSNAKDMENLPILLPDGRKVALSAVASVKDSVADRSQIALRNGKVSVGFQVYRTTGHGEPAVARDVRKAIEELKKANPGISITEVSSTVPRVEAGYKSAMNALLEGCILAIIVVMLFLKDWRATFISSVALPLSIIPTFGIMWISGFSLNTITFLALTLVVGILVDDAIVEVENVSRHMNGATDPVKAAKKAVEEIGLAVIATSLTLMAVFLPTGFMGGVVGRFFRQFGLTAAAAVGLSLLVARFITPMMAASMMKPSAEHEEGKGMKRYLSFVGTAVDNPKKTLLLSFLFLCVSLVLVVSMPSTFIPREDRGQITLSVEAEPGTRIETMQERMGAISGMLQTFPEIAGIYGVAGAASSAAPGGVSSAGDARKATFIIDLKKDMGVDQKTVEAKIRERMFDFPGIRHTFGMGASGEKMSIRLSGDDAELLKETAMKTESELRTLEWAGNVKSSANILASEIRVIPDRAKMAQYGVSTTSLASAMRIGTSGDYDLTLPKINLPERQIPVRVIMPKSFRTDAGTFENLRVAANGGTIPLSTVAELTVDSGPAQIDRYDRKRTVNIDVELNGKPLGDALKEANGLETLSHLPAGIETVPSGDAERLKELMGNFGMAMLAGIFCIYIVLVLLFHDFAQPVTILAALPLSAGGAFGMLSLFGYSLSMPAMIGLLMLMGIVTKNSILLVEYAVMSGKRGMSKRDAIIDACRKRARPILMTTVAMIAGMLPMALGTDGQSTFRAPMAIAVIGGLTTSTILSLVVIPVIYLLVDGIEHRIRGLFGRRSL